MAKQWYCLVLFILIGSGLVLAQDEMVYYEKYYPAYVQSVTNKIQDGIVAVLQDKLAEYATDEQKSADLAQYLAGVEAYQALDPVGYVKQQAYSFAKLWAVKGKVFSGQETAQKLSELKRLFSALRKRKNIQAAMAVKGDAEKGFLFVILFFVP